MKVVLQFCRNQLLFYPMAFAHRVGKFVISKSGWCTSTSLSVTHHQQVLPRNSSGCIVSAPIERSYDLPTEGRSPTTGLSQDTIDLTQIENRIMINLCKHLWWEKISTIQPSSYSIHSIHSEFYWINNNITNFLYSTVSCMHAYLYRYSYTPQLMQNNWHNQKCSNKSILIQSMTQSL